MTSRQPEITPPGLAGHAAATGHGGGRRQGDGPEAALSPEPEPAAGTGLTAQDWLVRLLPVALLIVVGLAGRDRRRRAHAGGAEPERAWLGTQAAADRAPHGDTLVLVPAAPGIRIDAARPGDRAALRP